MVAEALVGAAIVLLELVGRNDSKARAVIMAVHLINTSLLTFFMIVSWWAAKGPTRAGVRLMSGAGRRWVLSGALVILVVSAAGAVTALGDTLFPVTAGESLSDVALQATKSGGHFLRQLRGFHPVLASAGAAALIFFATRIESQERLRSGVIWVVIGQVSLGVVNIALSAPGWMQVVHLAMANLLWMLWVWIWLADAQRSLEVKA